MQHSSQQNLTTTPTYLLEMLGVEGEGARTPGRRRERAGEPSTMGAFRSSIANQQVGRKRVARLVMASGFTAATQCCQWTFVRRLPAGYWGDVYVCTCGWTLCASKRWPE
jgi:hypothetical protein